MSRMQRMRQEEVSNQSSTKLLLSLALRKTLTTEAPTKVACEIAVTRKALKFRALINVLSLADQLRITKYNLVSI